MRQHKPYKKGLIFVISGPSGSGKTTLAGRLVRERRLKEKIEKSISFTTRSKRQGERDGKEYFFISEPEFKRQIRAKKILEWTKYLGYYYATPKDFVESKLDTGFSMVLCLDAKGAQRIKKFYPRSSVTIFVAPPSLKTLRERIEGRCRDSKEEIKQRLKLAKKELLLSRKYDYHIENKKLSQAVRELKSILLKEIGR